MATFAISAVTRKAQATANGSTTEFAFSFSVNTEADVAVFVGTTLKTISTHYTVSITSSTGAGSITFTSGNTPTNGQIVTIMSKTALARSSVYTSGGTINATSLETDFDTNMMLFQQQDERLDRTLIAPVDDATSIDMTLPNKDARKGTVLGFNATSGNPEAGPSITAVQSLADVTTAINLLGTSDAVSDMNTLGTAAIVEDMNLLGTSANVTAMGLLGTSAAVADMAILGTSDVVADMAILATTDVVADMNTLATSDIISDLNTLATSDIVTDMNLLATSANVAAMGKLGLDAVIADMALLGTDAVVADLAILGTTDVVADMNTLATSDIVSDMNTLATSANVTAMGLLGTSAVVEDIGFLGTAAVVEDMGILGTSANVTAMSNVSGSISNVNTVASNLSGVNDFAARYRVGSSDPSSNNDDGDLFYNTSSDTLKIYNAGSSAWEAGATLGSGFLPLSGGQLTGNLTMAGSQTVDGRDVSADGTKLDGIEASATADQTNAEIRAAVEAASDSNVFTDSDHTKLNGIEASATADQTNAEIRAAVEAASDSNVFTDADHTKLNGVAASANNYVHPNHSGEVTSSADGATVIADNVVDEANLKVSNSPVNGYALTAQSGNTGGLTWAASSSYRTLISTTTIDDDATVLITGLDSTYSEYQFVITDLLSNDSDGYPLRMRVQANSAIDSTSGNYRFSVIYANSGGTSVANGYSGTNHDHIDINALMDNVSPDTSYLVFNIINPSGTTNSVMGYGRHVSTFNGHVYQGPMGFSYVPVTYPVTGLQFYNPGSSGTLKSGTIKLYGIS